MALNTIIFINKRLQILSWKLCRSTYACVYLCNKDENTGILQQDEKMTMEFCDRM